METHPNTTPETISRDLGTEEDSRHLQIVRDVLMGTPPGQLKEVLTGNQIVGGFFWKSYLSDMEYGRLCCFSRCKSIVNESG
jgi:hypothetical protein